MNKNDTKVCSVIERSLIPHSLQRCVMECVLHPPQVPTAVVLLLLEIEK